MSQKQDYGPKICQGISDTFVMGKRVGDCIIALLIWHCMTAAHEPCISVSIEVELIVCMRGCVGVWV